MGVLNFNLCVYIDLLKYDSSELGEELCPVSSSLPLRVHKVYIRVSFSDTFVRWLPPFVTIAVIISREKTFPLLPYWVVVVCHIRKNK